MSSPINSQVNSQVYFSPCKINLFLNISRKRSDGYHELETIMQSLDFGDDIRITFGNNTGIEILCDHPHVPKDSKNLIWKAIDRFYDTCGILNPGVSISLHKRIPLGAGLGGGSSNAITVLKVLNYWHSRTLSEFKMQEIAATLGSDTNFFLNNGTWLCSGRGECVVSKVESRRWTFLLLFPGFESSTPKVYERFIFDLTKPPSHPSLLESSLSQGTAEELEKHIHNDLRKAFLSCYPQGEILLGLIERETSKKVCVSGSGSTLFLVCKDDKEALYWKNRFQEKNIEAESVIAHTQTLS